MLKKKSVVAATVACGLALAALATESAGSGTRGDSATLSFSRSVALPGVTLAPGRYTFEIVEGAGTSTSCVCGTGARMPRSSWVSRTGCRGRTA